MLRQLPLLVLHWPQAVAALANGALRVRLLLGAALSTDLLTHARTYLLTPYCASVALSQPRLKSIPSHLVRSPGIPTAAVSM